MKGLLLSLRCGVLLSNKGERDGSCRTNDLNGPRGVFFCFADSYTDIHL